MRFTSLATPRSFHETKETNETQPYFLELIVLVSGGLANFPSRPVVWFSEFSKIPQLFSVKPEVTGIPSIETSSWKG
jgi:hypothetical protein